MLPTERPTSVSFLFALSRYSFADFVTADHYRACRRYLHAPGRPTFEQARHTLGFEDVPEELGHRAVLWPHSWYRATRRVQRRGFLGMTSNLLSSLAAVEWCSDQRSDSTGYSARDETVYEDSLVIEIMRSSCM